MWVLQSPFALGTSHPTRRLYWNPLLNSNTLSI